MASLNINALGAGIQFTTQEKDDRLIVAIKDEKHSCAYVIDAPDVDEGIGLISIMTQLCAPLIAQLAPPSGVDPKDHKPATEDLLFGISAGLSQLTPAQFSALARDIVKNVNLLVGEKEISLSGEMYNKHFKRKLAHLGVLIPQVIKHSDAALFFGGLVATLKSSGLLVSPSAQTSQKDISEATST